MFELGNKISAYNRASVSNVVQKKETAESRKTTEPRKTTESRKTAEPRKTAESSKTPSSRLISKASNVPDDDAAAAVIQHSLRGQLANFQQSLRVANTAISLFQSFRKRVASLRTELEQILEESAKENIYVNFNHSQNRAAELRKKLNGVARKINDVEHIKNNVNKLLRTNGQKISTLIDVGFDSTLNIAAKDPGFDDIEDMTLPGISGLLQKIKEVIERIRKGDTSKFGLPPLPNLLQRIKETMERLRATDWFLAGVQNRIEEITTNMQFNLQEILNVEQNIRNKNMNLEIGIYSLTRLLAEIYKALRSKIELKSLSKTYPDTVMEQNSNYREYFRDKAEQSGDISTVIDFDIADVKGIESNFVKALTLSEAANMLKQIIEKSAVILQAQKRVSPEMALQLLR